jgi:hypothetical protein
MLFVAIGLVAALAALLTGIFSGRTSPGDDGLTPKAAISAQPPDRRADSNSGSERRFLGGGGSPQGRGPVWSP